MKKFAVAGEKASAVGPHPSTLLTQPELHCEPIQLHRNEMLCNRAVWAVFSSVNDNKISGTPFITLKQIYEQIIKYI
jgi:hypothetical protein